MTELDSANQAQQSPLFSEGLWAFALRFYQAPGIKQACLRVQNDFSGNVLLLLWNKWLDQQRLNIDKEYHQKISRYIDEQSAQRLVPLRAARKELKNQSILDSTLDNTAQKDKILAQELVIEKELLAHLQLQTVSYCEGCRLDGLIIRATHPTQYTQNYLDSLNTEKALQPIFTEPFCLPIFNR